MLICAVWSAPCVVCFLKSKYAKLVVFKPFRFWLVSVVEQTGFKSCLVAIPEDKFSRFMAHLFFCYFQIKQLVDSSIFKRYRKIRSLKGILIRCIVILIY